MLTWAERIAAISVNPDMATRKDVADLAADLCEANWTLTQLMRGSCWCDVGIDHPIMKGRHTVACLQAHKHFESMKTRREG